jgi:P4 family phage/plasmid primase-like protien
MSTVSDKPFTLTSTVPAAQAVDAPPGPEKDYDEHRFGITRDGLHLVQWNRILQRWVSELQVQYRTEELGEIFPKECRTVEAALGRTRTILVERQAKIQRIKINVDEKSDPADIAAQLLKLNHLVTFNDTSQTYFWDDGVYLPNGENSVSGQVEEACEECGLRRIATRRLIGEIIGHVQRSTYRDRNEFDSNARVLNLKNGVLDLETLEFRSHDPSILTTVQLPVKYDATADCPNFKTFLKQVAYDEDIPVLQEFFGYCLWKDYLIHKALMLVGGGRNGKSTLLRVLKAILGNSNIASRSLQDFENRRFSTADLYGKLANIYSDPPDAALNRTGTFKMLTGGDPISAEFKFKNSFNFVNYAKLIFSCNKIPRAEDDTIAFFARWILITFPNTFEGPNEKKDLINELTTEEELSGIFNWALEGLIRLHTNKWTFSYSKSTEEVRKEYVRKSDPIGAFAMDCLAQKPDGQITKPDLYNAFRKYCLQTRLPVTSQDAFFKKLPQHVTYAEKRINLDGKRTRQFIGIELLAEDAWIQDGQMRLD